MNYAREATGAAISLRVLSPGLDGASFAGRVLGSLDVFVLWWVVLLAIGVGLLYGRQARSLTVAFLGVYAGLALLLAAAMTALGGTA